MYSYRTIGIYSMDKKLQDKLYKKYPKIFKDRNRSIRESCMGWGIDTGNGWYKILDILCSLLQWDTDENKYPQVVASQVKEKYGGLRFYTNGENDTQHGMIKFACALSELTCEECGSMTDVTQTSGWIVTLCPEHMKAYNTQRGIKDTKKTDKHSKYVKQNFN